ncbi:sarcosine oxidase subunit gamma [Micrococcales bacterium 31B]|nr:sarcosine oxidase subunit gamma [Micrococcales bacterium 31B]
MAETLISESTPQVGGAGTEDARFTAIRAARRSPAAHLAESFAAGSREGVVTLREVEFQTMIGVRVERESAAGGRIAGVLGGLPHGVGEVTGRAGGAGAGGAGAGGAGAGGAGDPGTGASGQVATLWLGPTEFLVVAPEADHATLGGDLLARLVAALGDERGQVVDLSANRTTFELYGPRAAEVVEKGCAIDMHERKLLPNSAYLTEIAHIPVVLWKTEQSSYRILPRASFADFLGRWLLDGMREYASSDATTPKEPA